MGIIEYKQVKGKIIVKRFNVHIEHIKHFKNRDSFLKQVKKKLIWKKKKEAKEKGTQIKSEFLEFIPYEFMVWCLKRMMWTGGGRKEDFGVLWEWEGHKTRRAISYSVRKASNGFNN